jgi:hypothetical protein
VHLPEACGGVGGDGGVKLRLLKVVVQAVFVLDDGETLSETTAEPVVVPANEWPTYPTEGFAQAFESLRQQVEGSGTTEVPHPIDPSGAGA